MEPSSILSNKSEAPVSGTNASSTNHTKYKEIISTLPRIEDRWLQSQQLHEYQDFCRDPELPLLSTHMPYTSLPKSIVEYLQNDNFSYAKRMAEFIRCPFSTEEERQGSVQKLVDLCSFEILSNLEVNKSEKHTSAAGPFRMENNAFFRKGKVGDWKNHLTAEMAARIDQITEQKFNDSGLAF
ncbi:hypothetical protein GH714_007257 [Hevea brasiliensis]|uniref:Sulfotransferase n=1 Tax=Hevea brasiliensis TaxID=3981 RepID=A0A6A6KJX1_HEVBR|nr:hypothetical protein GH714_007257 [Hevea brasiliensis]